MTNPEQPIDATTSAIHDILHTLGADQDPEPVLEQIMHTEIRDPVADSEQGVQDVTARLIRPEYRSVADAVAMTPEGGTVPAHHLSWNTVRASYLPSPDVGTDQGLYIRAMDTPRTYRNVEDITIDTEDLTPEAETVLGGLADEMLRQTGREASPAIRSLLMRHISAGMGVTMETATELGKETDDDPLRGFLNQVQSGLYDGSLLRGLEAASELHSMLPPPSGHRGVLGRLQGRLATMASIAERHTGRQAQVSELAERSREEGCLRVDELRAGDEITLTMTVDNHEPRDQIELKNDPLIFTRTIRGKIEHVGEQSYGSAYGETQHGAVVRITEDSRNNDLHFTDSPLEPGVTITLFATESMGTVGRSYEQQPIVDEEFKQGYPPILIDADGYPSEMQVCNLAGYASMGLSQMTINGQSMFREGWQPPADDTNYDKYYEER